VPTSHDSELTDVARAVAATCCAEVLLSWERNPPSDNGLIEAVQALPQRILIDGVESCGITFQSENDQLLARRMQAGDRVVPKVNLLSRIESAILSAIAATLD
jgi:hypothetical protein